MSPVSGSAWGVKNENSLVFIGRERFWRSGWRPLEFRWASVGIPLGVRWIRLGVRGPSGAVKKLSKSEKSLVFVGPEGFWVIF